MRDGQEHRQCVALSKLLRVVPVLALTLFMGPLFAKRAAPPPVSPVLCQGIKYSAPNDNGRVGYVLASDSGGKKLFQITVFETEIDPKLEEDVQWVFIIDLRLSGNSLLVKDEKSRCFSINLDTRVVEKKHRC
ncbi:MAG: hypothetical protein WBF04_16875 [Candidatus Sulfotelmatobacter sp.]